MATTDEHRTIAPIVGPDDPRRFTDSGIEIKPLYTEEDLPDKLAQRLGEPGEYPYTRGVHAEMYRKQLWTMRQLARDGMTMIVVTHEMGFAREVADKAVFMADGVVVESGPPAEVLVAPQHDRTKSFLSKVL